MKFWKEMFRKKTLSAICFLFLLFILFVAIFADVIAPTKMVGGMIQSSLVDAKLPPLSPGHLLGTDERGVDLLSYMIYGARTSVILCLCCTILQTIVSIILGILSAVLGGAFDLILQRIVDAFGCIPQMLLLLLMMTILGNGIPQMVIAMAVPAGIGGSRMIRSAAFAVKDSGYCKNSDLLGGGFIWKSVKHVLPNIMPLIIISAAGSLGAVIMMEASMNFLGYGVAPGTPSWGAIITSQGRTHMFDAPWICLVPGIAITILTFASCMFGDGVRDVLDPRLKGGVGSYNSKKLKKVLEKLAEEDAQTAMENIA
ncbi:MAG: ABC transporter permease [Eubacterium sp.]|nr:ABC transporter permease [Eubacterium sp.]